MPIYMFQNTSVTGSATVEVNFNIKGEWIYFIGIYVKNDGIDILEMPDLNIERDRTALINIESLLELNLIRYWDEEYKLKLEEKSTSTNEITVIVLTANDHDIQKLALMGISPTALKQLHISPS